MEAPLPTVTGENADGNSPLSPRPNLLVIPTPTAPSGPSALGRVQLCGIALLCVLSLSMVTALRVLHFTTSFLKTSSPKDITIIIFQSEWRGVRRDSLYKAYL